MSDPELTDALDSALAMDGRSIVDAYEGGRCDAFQRLHTTAQNALYLATPQGSVVCGNPGIGMATALKVTAGAAEAAAGTARAARPSTAARQVDVLRMRILSTAWWTVRPCPGSCTLSLLGG